MKPDRQTQLRQILSLTMAGAQILAQGGFVRDYRHAHRKLRALRAAGIAGFCEYPVGDTFRYFYYLKEPKRAAHEIKPGTAFHDSLTAIFLVRVFCRGRERGFSIRWYPPFAIDGKTCDGGMALFQNGRLFRSVLLETDTGAHDHAEIEDKLQAYGRFLTHPRREIVFIVPSEDRIRHLRKTLREVLPDCGRSVFFINPLRLSTADTRPNSKHPGDAVDARPREAPEIDTAVDVPEDPGHTSFLPHGELFPGRPPSDHCPDISFNQTYHGTIPSPKTHTGL